MTTTRPTPAPSDGPSDRPSDRPSDTAVEDEAVRLVTRRIIPLIMLLFLVAYVDRSNISVAALTMNADIGLSATAFGFGAGIFYVSYILAEVPSSLALARFGARRWIARIMISWGVVAGCMALVQGPVSFSVLRVLLGAAEAGFTPGIIFYLALWFPARHRAKAMAQFYVGSALATVIGVPLSGLIVQMHGLGGIAGWRWLFLLEAVPAVVLGFVVLRVLTDTPREAHWLPARSREWLVAVLDTERRAVEAQRRLTWREALVSPGILLLALFLFLYSFNSIGLTLWMPQVIKGTFGSPSDLATSLLTAVPYACAVVGMLAVAASLARRAHPHLHMAVPMAASSVLLAGSVAAGASLLGFVLLAVSTGLAWSAIPALWATATSFTTGVAAAVGVAVINSLANVAGLVVAPLIGRVRDATGSFAPSLLIIAAAMLAAAVVAVASRRATTPGGLAERVAATGATALPPQR